MENSTRNIVLGTIAALALALAAWRFVSKPPQKFEIPKTINHYAVCLSCKQESLISHPKELAAPWECPACGEKACYQWLYCSECNYRFVPNLVWREGIDHPIPNPYPYCTHCGCTNVTAFSPNNPDQAPLGDAPLPEWPPVK
ncbi:MAG: hypothetical protein D6744_04925 [Planctomycetota bacterium]|nr:MAG: hypothetical protein D6744_04925 [Planctomycetota bacterium]